MTVALHKYVCANVGTYTSGILRIVGKQESVHAKLEARIMLRYYSDACTIGVDVWQCKQNNYCLFSSLGGLAPLTN